MHLSQWCAERTAFQEAAWLVVARANEGGLEEPTPATAEPPSVLPVTQRSVSGPARWWWESWDWGACLFPELICTRNPSQAWPGFRANKDIHSWPPPESGQEQNGAISTLFKVLSPDKYHSLLGEGWMKIQAWLVSAPAKRKSSIVFIYSSPPRVATAMRGEDWAAAVGAKSGQRRRREDGPPPK